MSGVTGEWRLFIVVLIAVLSSHWCDSVGWPPVSWQSVGSQWGDGVRWSLVTQTLTPVTSLSRDHQHCLQTPAHMLPALPAAPNILCHMIALWWEAGWSGGRLLLMTSTKTTTQSALIALWQSRLIIKDLVLINAQDECSLMMFSPSSSALLISFCIKLQRIELLLKTSYPIISHNFG